MEAMVVSVPSIPFRVGQIVNVAARTGPGINKPGGVARITDISSSSPTTVSVKYVIDSRYEREIHLQYIADYEEKTRLRDRNVLLGRCSNCGSLRTDCDSCDIRVDGTIAPLSTFRLEALQSLDTAAPLPAKALRQDTLTTKPKQTTCVEEEDNSSDDTEKLCRRMHRNHRLFQRFKAKNAATNKALGDQYDDAADGTAEVAEAQQINRDGAASKGSLSNRDRSQGRKRQRIRRRLARHTGAADLTLQDIGAQNEDGSSSISSQGSIESEDSYKRWRSEDADRASDTSSSAESTSASDDDEEYYSEAVQLNKSFLAPEGDAEKLPADVQDMTAGKSRSELLVFFDAIIQKLEQSSLPRAKKQYRRYKNQLDKMNARYESESAADRSLLLGQIKQLGSACKMAADSFDILLINQQVDQCFMVSCKIAVGELRDLKLFEISQRCQEIIKEMRSLSERAHELVNEKDETAYDDEEGWTYPCDDEIESSDDVTFDRAGSVNVYTGSGAPNNAHPHAKKRRKTHSITGYRWHWNSQYVDGSSVVDYRSRRKGARRQLSNRANGKRTPSLYGRTSNGMAWTDNHTSESSSDDDIALANLLESKQVCVMSGRSVGLSRQNAAKTKAGLPLSMPNRRRVTANISSRRKRTNREKEKSELPSCRVPVESSTFSPRIRPARSPLIALEDNSNDGRFAGYKVQEKLFMTLKVRGDATRRDCLRNRHIDRALSLNDNLSDYFAAIKSAYPHGESADLLEKLVLAMDTSFDGNFLEILLELLRTKSCETIHFYVSTESPALRSHISLLSLILRSLREGGDGLLRAEHASSILLSGEGRNHLISCVLEQLVESVYALVHPTPWAMVSTRDPMYFFKELSLLRHELAQHCNLMEGVSNVLLEKLPVQSWVISNDGNHLYVSSTRPKEWMKLLKTGEISRQVAPSRFETLGERLPISEVNAVFAILGFFADETLGATESGSQKLWSLLAKLFTRGVLCVDNLELPPSESQMSHIADCIQKLVLLMRSGSVTSIPANAKCLAGILQSVVCQQADFCLNEGKSNAALLPALQPDRDIQRSVKSFWCSLLKPNATLAKVRSKNFTFLGQPLITPALVTHRSCIELLSLYLSLIPGGKSPRRKRSYADLNGMNDFLERTLSIQICEASTLDQRDPFASAFGIALSQETNSRSSIRNLSISHAVACFKIQLHLQSSDAPSVSFCESIWALLASDTMKQRQSQKDLDDLASSPESLSTDPLQLSLASKTITFVACQYLGLDVLALSTSVTAPSAVVAAVCDASTLHFLLSCLLCCLDCLCVAVCRETLMEMMNTSACLGLVATRMRQLLVAPSSGNYKHAIRHLPRSLFQLTVSSFWRCLVSIIVDGDGYDFADSAMVSILSMLESIMLLKLQIDAKEEARLAAAVEDELFSGITDDALAAVDLDVAGIVPADTKQVWQLLLEIVLESKPSSRFIVNDVHSLESGSAMRAAGKAIIVRHLSGICRCLALIAAQEAQTCTTHLVSLSEKYPSSGDANDLNYVRGFTTRLSLELIRLGEKSRKVRMLLRQHDRHFIATLMCQLCDGQLIHKLPSGDLSLFRRRGGDEYRERAMMGFMSRSESHSSAKCQIQVQWDEFLKLCQIMAQHSELQDADSFEWFNQLNQEPSLLGSPCFPGSLEHECLKRYLYLRAAISFAPKQYMQFLIPSLLASTMGNLTRMENKVVLADPMTFEGTQYIATYSCVVELHVATVCMLLSRHRHEDNAQLACLRNKILVQFILPLLKHDSIDLLAAFRDVTVDCDHALNGRGITSTVYRRVVDATGVNKLTVGILGKCFARHARSLVMHLVHPSPAFSGFNLHAFFDAVLSSAASWSAVRAFSCHPYDWIKEDEQLSPFQVALYSHLSDAEGNKSLKQATVTSLRALKQTALSDILASILAKGFLSDGKKVSSLQLVRRLLDLESEESSESDGVEPRIGCFVISKIMRGLRLTLLKTLTAAKVNDELVESAYQCAKSMTHLPATCLEFGSVGWLVDWCDLENVAADDGALAYRQYLQWSIIWLRQIATKLVGSDSLIREIATERAKLREQSVDVVEFGHCLMNDPWSRMVEFEGVLFPSSGPGTTIRNVYAMTQPSDKGLILDWKPSHAVQKAVASFLVVSVRGANACTS